MNIMDEEKRPAHMKIFDIEKMKEPHGDKNFRRLNNINDYDLLVHIQQTLSIKNQCIIEIITGNGVRCINHNETIDRKVKNFAMQDITDEFRKENPKYTDDEGNETETDENYECRLCHLIMQHNHPRKLQMIKCAECIHQWMNSDKW